MRGFGLPTRKPVGSRGNWTNVTFDRRESILSAHADEVDDFR